EVRPEAEVHRPRRALVGQHDPGELREVVQAHSALREYARLRRADGLEDSLNLACELVALRGDVRDASAGDGEAHRRRDEAEGRVGDGAVDDDDAASGSLDRRDVALDIRR